MLPAEKREQTSYAALTIVAALAALAFLAACA